MAETPARDDLALVLTGGGARAAYQVGVLTWLARELPELRIPILTGVFDRAGLRPSAAIRRSRLRPLATLHL